MDSYHDRRDEERMAAKGNIRQLPYLPEGAVAHYDFLNSPELIPHVLEDFKPHGGQAGVRKFYRLLKWLNGPRSIFETTDCLLRPPRPNPSPALGGGAPLEVVGRVMLIFRDHQENLDEQATRALQGSFGEEFDKIRAGWAMGCIGISSYRAGFSSLTPEPAEWAIGRELVLLFWAWGANDTECFDNFGTLMLGVGVALCRVQGRHVAWVNQRRHLGC